MSNYCRIIDGPDEEECRGDWDAFEAEQAYREEEAYYMRKVIED